MSDESRMKALFDPNVSFEQYAQMIMEDSKEHNHLGKAADFRHAAEQAIKDKKFDKAWGLIHNEEDEYIRHANHQKWNALQAIGLHATASANRANILRMEGKHRDAFLSFLYSAAQNNCAMGVGQEKKLTAYYKRAKFTKTTLDEIVDHCKKHLINEFSDLKEMMLTVWE